MSINPSIPLGVQPLQPFDLTRGALQGAQLKRMAAISAQEEAERQEKDRERAEKDAITNVLRESQGDLAAAIPRIRQINPIMAAQIEQTMTDAQEAKVKLAKARLDHDLNAAEFISRQLNGVTDQQSYDYARAAIGGAGLPTEGMNPQFDPGYVESLKAKGLSVKEQLDIKQKEIERIFQERKFQAEQQNVSADNKRADTAEGRQAARDEQLAAQSAAQLAISRGHLSVSQAQLGIARQKLAQDAKAGAEVTKLPAAIAEKVAGVEQSLAALGDLERLKKDEWLGPIGGRMSQARIRVPGASVSPELGEFAAQTSTLKNAVIKATTGAAMSEPEAQRIMQQIPDFTDKPEVWKQKAVTTKRNLELLRRRMLELSGVPQGAPTTTTPVNAAAPAVKKNPFRK